VLQGYPQRNWIVHRLPRLQPVSDGWGRVNDQPRA
jgi:hypothetical protein